MTTRNSPQTAKNLSPTSEEGASAGVNSKGKKRRLVMDDTVHVKGDEEPDVIDRTWPFQRLS